MVSVKRSCAGSSLTPTSACRRSKARPDAEATQIYSEAYNTSPVAADFYQFMKTLETYKAPLGRDTTLILTTDSDLFKFIKRLDGGSGKPVTNAPAGQP